jgi:hypothetical protein
MITIKDAPTLEKSYNLSETSQRSKILFSIAVKKKGEDTFYRLTPLIRCRDFLNEFFVSTLGQYDFGNDCIYGYRPIKYSVRHKRKYLIISGYDKSLLKEFVEKVNLNLSYEGMSNLKILDPQEVLCEYRGRHDGQLSNMLIIEVPHYWWKNSFNVAMLTFYLRGESVSWEDMLLNNLRFYCEGFQHPYNYLPLIKNSPDLTSKEKIFVGKDNKDNLDPHVLHNCGLCYYFKGAFAMKLGFADRGNEIVRYLAENI